MKFAIVDDDSVLLRHMQLVLEEAEHGVACYESSLQALCEIPVTQPDVVIVDIMTKSLSVNSI